MRRLLDHRGPPGRDNAAFRLALAGEKLVSQSQEAVSLYASVADEHDLRDAWLGLACAYHVRAEAARAHNKRTAAYLLRLSQSTRARQARGPANRRDHEKGIERHDRIQGPWQGEESISPGIER